MRKQSNTSFFALNPKDVYKLFNNVDKYKLVEIFNSQDFTEQDKSHLRFKLQHYKLDVSKHLDFQDISSNFKKVESLSFD